MCRANGASDCRFYPYPALAGWANVCRAYGAGDSFGMTGARGTRGVARQTRRYKKRGIAVTRRRKMPGFPTQIVGTPTKREKARRYVHQEQASGYFVEACFMGDGKFERMRVSTRD
jgi:hypothetical protein